MREFNAALIQKAVNGDQDAIGELYRLTYSNVYHTVKSMILDEDTVLDVVQDTYLKAFDSLDQLDTPEHFKAWIKRIATNKAKDYLKRKRPILFSEMAAEDGTEVEFEDECVGHLPEEVLDRKETIRLMDEILSTLSEDQQLAIGMFYFEQMSITEIAAALGCSENTVKSRLNYGRKKVKVKVEELEKKGTKLYSLAPLPFFLWLLKSMDAATEVPSAAILENITAQCSVGAAPVKAAKGGKYSGKYATGSGTTKAAAGGAAKATAGGAAKAVGVKVAAGILAVAIAGGGAVVWAGSQKDEQPDTPSFAATEELDLAATEGAAPQATEQAETQSIEETEAAPVLPIEAAYQGVVSQYAEVLNMDSQTFLDAYWNGEDTYFNGDHTALFYHHSNMAEPFCYAYHDIDGNGTEELLIGTGGIIVDVYGFDGTNAVHLIDEPTAGERTQVEIYDDGVINMIGHGVMYEGEESDVWYYWHFSPDGASLESGAPSDGSLVSDFSWQPIGTGQIAPMDTSGNQGAASTAAVDFDAVLNDVRAVCALSYEEWNANRDYYAENYPHTGADVNWILQQERVVEAADGVHTFDVFWGTGDLNGDGEEDLLISYGRQPETGKVCVLYLSGLSAPITGNDVTAYLPEGQYPEEYATWHRDIDVYYYS